jgi:hypothetical protein
VAGLTGERRLGKRPSRRSLPGLRLALTAAAGLSAALTALGPATAASSPAGAHAIDRQVATRALASQAGRAAPARPVPASCRRPRVGADGFPPTSLRIGQVVGPTRVLARGRDRNGVPRTPPLTSRGKWQFAWDKSVRTGAAFGITRLTAHTYPAWAGRALGNRLLDRLRRGRVLVVTGPRGQRLCYRVTHRISVAAETRVPAFYSSGRHRLAILVCSGVRRGPGDWSRRTMWFAEPIGLRRSG